jgi:RHS repeat-associated protein
VPRPNLLLVRARYYNSLTGRFLSRDPEAGEPIAPKTLHKYLYAGGDPVNSSDPTGKDDLLEYARQLLVINQQIIRPSTVGLGIGNCVSNALDNEATFMDAALLGEPTTGEAQAIAQTLTQCTGRSIKYLLGPIVSRTF